MTSEVTIKNKGRGYSARRIRRGLILLLVVIGVWTVLAWSAAKFLLVNAPLKHADAIVVLSGSACLIERTNKAAQLYHSNVASRVVLTNDNLRGTWSSAEQRNPFFYERARDNLVRVGVPQQQIEVIYQPVAGTYDEAKTVRDYAQAKGFRSIVVVTSGYHSRRALWTLQRVFHDSNVEVGLQAVDTGIQTPSPLTWWLQPRGWEMVAGEYVKSVYYRLNVG
jgi:uncharacterized SAM-binding protein YcdF (DUF218 family)